ncbi:hypothetical protein, partial [Enterococcus casseliflavus]|uniref:hypothetical protein n=1 Tax=Enterococcus casseliflavus TaxID=37734 RepID=UPI003D0B037A
AGVDLDLRLEAVAPSFGVFPHDRFAEDGIAWYEVELAGEGSIVHDGRRLDVRCHGCHERVIVTRDHVPEKMLGRGLYWQHLFADRVQAWV